MQTIRDALEAVPDATPSMVEGLLSRLRCDGTEDVRDTLLEVTEEQINNMQLSFRLEFIIKRAQRKARNPQPPTGLMTAFEVIGEPCPGIDRRLGLRASKSRAVQPRTFADLKELKDFESDLVVLRSQLNNTNVQFYSPKYSVHGGKFAPTAAVADLRAPLAVVAPLVNRIAKDAGIKAMLLGGGSNRTFSSADWMVSTITSAHSRSSSSDVRTAASGSSSGSAVLHPVPSTPATNWPSLPATARSASSSNVRTAGSSSTSDRVLSCIAFGDWPMHLHIGEKLWRAVEQQHQWFMPGLQQLYGDMIQDEVQWGMLSTGDAHVIVKRDDDVRDRTLYVSLVFGNDTLLLALLYLLQQAAAAEAKKQQLSRDLVTVTPAAAYTYSIELPVVQQTVSTSSKVQHTRPTSHVNLGRAVKRQRQVEAALEAAADQSSLEIAARSSDDSHGSSSSSCSLHSSFPRLIQLSLGRTQLTPATDQTASSSDCLTVTTSATDFSRLKLLQVLAAGSHGGVYQGEIQGTEVVVKSFHPRFPGFEDAFRSELGMYYQASDLQGDVVCDVIHFGIHADTGAPFLALSPAGTAIDSSTAAASASVRQGMHLALSKLHQQGILHGDICLSNFCVADDGRIKIIDLDKAYPRHVAKNAEAEMQEELEQLDRLLQDAAETAETAITGS